MYVYKLLTLPTKFHESQINRTQIYRRTNIHTIAYLLLKTFAALGETITFTKRLTLNFRQKAEVLKKIISKTYCMNQLFFWP